MVDNVAKGEPLSVDRKRYDKDECLKRMEPFIPSSLVHEAAAVSIAISLKRIADALTEAANMYGETAIPALARAISGGNSQWAALKRFQNTLAKANSSSIANSATTMASQKSNRYSLKRADA